MSHQTAEEARQDYIAKLGPDLGIVFDALRTDVASLVLKWQEFVDAFGTNEARVDIMNAAGGLFCRLIQDAMWDDILMHISRLTDKEKVSGKETLSIRMLPPLVPPSIRDEVTLRIEAALQTAAFARDLRNRRLAHNDRRIALDDPTALPLAPASRRTVDDALRAIHGVLNFVSESLMQMGQGFLVLSGGADAGAKEFLSVLKEGLLARHTRVAQLRSGGMWQPGPDIDEPLRPDLETNG